jgi:hypothetical protein
MVLRWAPLSFYLSRNVQVMQSQHRSRRACSHHRHPMSHTYTRHKYTALDWTVLEHGTMPRPNVHSSNNSSGEKYLAVSVIKLDSAPLQFHPTSRTPPTKDSKEGEARMGRLCLLYRLGVHYYTSGATKSEEATSQNATIIYSMKYLLIS